MSASPIDLTGEITERLNTADPKKVVVLSYVDAANRPHVSVRGSVIAHSKDQLAFWVREGYVGTMTPGAEVGSGTMQPAAAPAPSGVLTAIETNPNISLLYRSGTTTYVFAGQARVEDDPSICDEIFAMLPEGEQRHSTVTGKRTGTAVIVDLDHVIGGSLAEGGVIASHVDMVRS